MITKSPFTAVAWVPGSWDPEEARAASALAMKWSLDHSLAAGRKPVLRVHSHAHDWRHPTSSFAGYAKVANVVTDRGSKASGPTLVPSAHSMKLVAGGMDCACGFALVVEEHPALPLAAWAAELQAVDLRTGQPTHDSRPPELAARIHTLTSSLYNGWSSEPGKSAARHLMPELAEAGVAWADFAGSVLAVARHHIDEKDMLRWAPPRWKREIEERRERNIYRARQD